MVLAAPRNSNFRRAEHILAAKREASGAASGGLFEGRFASCAERSDDLETVMLKLLAAGAALAFALRRARRRRRSSARDAAHCRAGRQAGVLVNVEGFKRAHRQCPGRALRQRSAQLPRKAAATLRKVDVPVTPRRDHERLHRGARPGPLCGRGSPRRRRRQWPAATGATAAASRATRASSLTNLAPALRECRDRRGPRRDPRPGRAQLPLRPVDPAGRADGDRVALLSNPRSTGNLALLPRVRALLRRPTRTSSTMRSSSSTRSARR